MKELRKVAALLLALALVLSVFPMGGLVAFAEETVETTVETPADVVTEEPVEEVVSKETAEAAALLQSLNILKGDEQGNLNLTGDVTRAEFAAFVVRMIGQENVALVSGGKQIFDDVAADHWGNGYIDVAYNAGIILGYGDGNFGPEAPVTYEQAIKMIVCALGYGDVAIDRGGWPTGYLRVADEKKVTKNVAVVGGAPAKRGDIVSMIYNSLEIDVMRTEKVIKKGKEATEYIVVKGDNVLTYFLGLHKAEGVVTANGDTSILNSAKVRDTQIQLGYVDVFEVGTTGADAYLGQSVDLYYTVDEMFGKNNIVSVKVKKDNVVVEVSGDDISLDATTEEALVWEEDDKEVEFLLNKDAAVIVNHRFLGFVNSIPLETITPDNGTVTLIDNDDDEYADVIIVDAFQTLIVHKIDEVAVAVIDKYSDSGKLYGLYVNSESYDATVKDTKGKDVDVKKLKEWDVVCLYQSGDEKIKNAIVCTDKVKGKYTKKTSDGWYTINGEAYKFSNAYLTYLEENPSEAPVLGETYTFLLDINGKIAGCQKEMMTLAANQAYGYLISAKKAPSEGRAKLYIYTSNGEFKTIPTAEKLKVNGYPKDSGSTERIDLLFINETDRSRVLKEITSEELISERAYYNNVLASGAILYKTNAEGEIIELLTDTSDTASYPNFKDYYNGLFVQAAGDNTSLYNYGSILGGKFRITSKTVKMQVPTNLDDEDFFGFGPPALFANGDKGPYNVELYDVKENGEVGLAIFRSSYEVTADYYYDSGRLFYVFRDTEEQLNKDDEIVSIINYGPDDAIKNAEVAVGDRFIEASSLDDELAGRKTLGTKIEEVYEFYNAGKDIDATYHYPNTEDVKNLRYGDAVIVVTAMNKAASVAPLLKLTGIDVDTGRDVDLKDVHFEYGSSSDISDKVAGKRLVDLLDNSIPFDDKGFENPTGRNVYYGEAVESTSTSMSFFTTTKVADDGSLVRTKRMIPTGAIQQTIFINMKEGTIATGSASNIRKGDKVLVNWRHDLNNNCYIYVYRW